MNWINSDKASEPLRITPKSPTRMRPETRSLTAYTEEMAPPQQKQEPQHRPKFNGDLHPDESYSSSGVDEMK